MKNARSLTVSILSDNEILLEKQKEISEWATDIHLAYYCIHSNQGKAKHWKTLPTAKVKRAIIGTRNDLTEPFIIEVLVKRDKTRVRIDDKRTFHPKVLVCRRGRTVRAIVGSSNLTTQGFGKNVEMNILLEGPSSDPEIALLLQFLDCCWNSEHVEMPTHEWLSNYEIRYRQALKRERRQSKIRKTYLGRVAPALPSNFDIEWSEFYGIVLQQHGRILSNKKPLFIFGYSEKFGSYLEEISQCRAAFKKKSRFHKMSVDERYLVAGFGGGSWGYFGWMSGAGYFKNIVREYSQRIGGFLDQIPHSGNVLPDTEQNVIEGLLRIRGLGIATVSRLLCVKRPDLYFPVNNGNRPRLRKVFGYAPGRTASYIKLLNTIRGFAWAESERPHEHSEIQVWENRIALIDSLMYEHPPSRKTKK